jgi:hypothetical protein
MPKTHVQVNVNFTQSPINCSPDPVRVKKSANDGVTWKASQTGYTFTGVTIGDITYTPPPTGAGEFKDVTITTENNKSVMKISDTVSDTQDHSYTLNYTDTGGNAHQFDPTIKNEN